MARILVVDDSPTELQAARSALEADNHVVMTENTANGGIEAAKKNRPDLILMDVVFDGMSGFQGTRKLSRDEETAGIPVIIVSSKNQEADRIWGLRQGAVEYLVKPVPADKLRNTVNEVLKNRGAQRSG